MKIAFYAPMKSPHHSVPSGDRTMARLLMSALRKAGHEVVLASQLRSYEGRGDSVRQQRIRDSAAKTCKSLLQRYRKLAVSECPDLWFSYHLYHKAPDLLGPEVSQNLGIPYVVAEASHAPKQASGPWSESYVAAREAILVASRVIALNPVDIACVNELLGTHQGKVSEVSLLAPFIYTRRIRRWSRKLENRSQLASEIKLDPQLPVLICVAMMRRRAKLSSYTLLAKSLKLIEEKPWQLLIIGDGEASDEVWELYREFMPGRVKFLGLHTGQNLAQYLGLADVFVWPAIDEAWGMVFLEAAAAGLPCVAGANAGVSQVVAHERSGLLVPAADPQAFAEAIKSLLDNPEKRRELSKGASAKAIGEHDLESAALQLNAILEGL